MTVHTNCSRRETATVRGRRKRKQWWRGEGERGSRVVTGLSAWLMPRMKTSSEKKSAAAPLWMMLVLLHCRALRQSRKMEVRSRKPSVTPTVLHVSTLMGRISPFCTEAKITHSLHSSRGTETWDEIYCSKKYGFYYFTAVNVRNDRFFFFINDKTHVDDYEAAFLLLISNIFLFQMRKDQTNQSVIYYWMLSL